MAAEHWRALVVLDSRYIDFSYNPDQTVNAVTDLAGRAFQIGYTDGLLTSIKDPTGAITTYALDLGPQPGDIEAVMKTIQTPDGYITTYTQYVYGMDPSFTVQRGEVEYDYSFGFVGVGAEDASFSAHDGYVYNSYYNDQGDIRAVVDPLGAVRSANYSHRGLPILVEDALNRVSSMSYDDNGRMLSHTNPLGETVSQCFDADYGNRLWTQDAQGYYTSFSYFGDGQNPAT